VYATGSSRRPWAPVTERIPGITLEQIQEYYVALFGPGHAHDSNGDHVPDEWVFNDFGPWAVRYFVDKNHDKKLDAGESLSGEMIHTTPDTEGQVAQGKAAELVPSHGCIHVSPLDRDRFHAAGAFDRGLDLIIHRYDETVPRDMK
jgi:hypothetical protein